MKPSALPATLVFFRMCFLVVVGSVGTRHATFQLLLLPTQPAPTSCWLPFSVSSSLLYLFHVFLSSLAKFQFFVSFGLSSSCSLCFRLVLLQYLFLQLMCVHPKASFFWLNHFQAWFLLSSLEVWHFRINRRETPQREWFCSSRSSWSSIDNQ